MTIRTRIATAAILPVVLLSACASQTAGTPKPVDTSADVAELLRMQDRELDMLNAGNIDSMLTNYTDDIIMMAPDAPLVNGHAALRSMIEGMLKDATPNAKYTSSDVDVHGDIAIVRYTGTMTMTPKAAGAAPVTHSIKGIHVYTRQPDGRWKIAQDVWNNDPMPATAGKGQ